MRKYLIYVYGVAFIILLNYVGFIADDLLLSLLRFFNLTEEPYIRMYLLLISITLLIASYLLIASCKGQQISKNVVVRIIIGIVIGGIGSVWLLMVFTSHNL